MLYQFWQRLCRSYSTKWLDLQWTTSLSYLGQTSFQRIDSHWGNVVRHHRQFVQSRKKPRPSNLLQIYLTVLLKYQYALVSEIRLHHLLWRFHMPDYGRSFSVFLWSMRTDFGPICCLFRNIGLQYLILVSCCNDEYICTTRKLDTKINLKNLLTVSNFDEVFGKKAV